MKSMLSIAKLISRQKVRKLDVLTEEVLTSKTSKFRELYDALQDGKVRNDREAARLLYDALPTDARYRQLKSRFRKRLLNTLFFVDQNRPHRSSFDQTYHNCQRDWSLINILRANAAQEPAVDMARSLLTCCLKYGFTELTVQVARFLAAYATDTGNAKEVARLERIIEKGSATFTLELRAQRLLRQLQLMEAEMRSDPSRALQLKEIEATGRHLEALAEQTESPMVQYDALEGSAIVAALNDNPEAVIALVDQAITYGEENPRRLQEPRVRRLRMRQLLMLVRLRDLSRGELAVRSFEACCKPGDEAWHELRRVQCALALAGGEHHKAQQITRVVTTHRGHRSLSAPVRESWELFAALAFLASPAGTTTDFSSTAFLRKEATFGGEHQLLNVWRITLQAAIKRKLHRYHDLSDEISALRQLAVRKLDSKRDTRIIAFIQVLYRLERRNFDGHVDRIAERYLHSLMASPFVADTSPDHFMPFDVIGLLEHFGVQESVSYA